MPSTATHASAHEPASTGSPVPAYGQHAAAPKPPAHHGPAVPITIGLIVLAVLAVGAVMMKRAANQVNKIALHAAPKGVTVVKAKLGYYRARRDYVGTIEPWVQARIGPQFISAYVNTVLVRPGSVVKKGDVLATLDCRTKSAASRAVSQHAEAIKVRQKAIFDEAQRMAELLKKGYTTPNEVELKLAESARQQAELMASKERLQSASLEVQDCVLRAPFDGEIAERLLDPGAFVRPGTAILTMVDRSVLRIEADVPEIDFQVVAVNTPVKIGVISTGATLEAKISRRAPAADLNTRTVHFEIDVPDPERLIPVGTTAALGIEVGEPIRAIELPLATATIRGEKANVFIVEDGVAKVRVLPVLGEYEGVLYLEPKLKDGTWVVLEGRALLNNNDKVAAELDPVLYPHAHPLLPAVEARPASLRRR